MTVTTVTVTIAVNEIIGTGLPAGRVTFELTGPDINASIISTDPTTVTLDSNGAGTVALWPNALGSQGTQYRVTIVNSNGDLQFTGLATIPNSNCNLYAVLNLDAPATVSDVSAHIADATDAHDASAISVSAITGRTAVNAQTMLAELSGAIDDLVVSAGVTDLANTPSPTGILVTSSSGADTTLPLADGTNAGLLAPADFTRLANTSGTNTGDQDLSSYATTAAVAAGYQPLDSDLTAIAALTTTSYGRAFLALADAAAARTALSLGTAAQSATGDFDAAGAAAAAQAASQPLDSDLTAIAALTTTTFGRALLALADAAALRTAAGLGTAATSDTGDFATAAQGATADSALQPGDISNDIAADDGSTTKVLSVAETQAAIAAGGGGFTGTDTRIPFAGTTGALEDDAGLTYNKTNKALTVGGATVTTSNPVANFSQTWNASGVTFTGIKLNVTNTASASGSLLMDLQVGGTSLFSVVKSGATTIGVANATVALTFGSGGSSNSALRDNSGVLEVVNGTNNAFKTVKAESFTATAAAAFRFSNGHYLQTGPNSESVISSTGSFYGGIGAGRLTIYGAANLTLDLALDRNSGKVLEINSGTAGTYPGTALVLGPQTVAQLPTAASGIKGARATVTDATSTTFMAAPVGGGSTVAPVFCNGTSWLIG